MDECWFVCMYVRMYVFEIVGGGVRGGVEFFVVGCGERVCSVALLSPAGTCIQIPDRLCK